MYAFIYVVTNIHPYTSIGYHCDAPQPYSPCTDCASTIVCEDSLSSMKGLSGRSLELRVWSDADQALVEAL